MKKYFLLSIPMILCLGLAPAYSQPGRTPAMPRWGGHMTKLFGEISAFSATLEIQSRDKAGNMMTMPGKIFFLDGKSRMEQDLTKMKGGDMAPGAAEQMKSVGMDTMVTIQRPDKKTAWLIYPGLQAYIETSLKDPDAARPASDYKSETTELGKETVDGHPCVKNKVVVTDDQGGKHESIVWNATDLKKFPVKIETSEQGQVMTLLFKDVKFSKPDAGLFDPPSGCTRYDSMPAMMQAEMMKRMGGGAGGFPPLGQ